MLLLLLGAAALWRLREKSLPALGFLLMAVAALPTSNLLFPTGTIFAERLAYLPSAGFCVIAASWIAGSAPAFDALPRRRLAVLAAATLLLSMRTIVRNPVWANDEALFTNMIRVSPKSAKAHYDYALHVGADAGIRAARWSTTSGRPRSIRATGTPGRGAVGWSGSSGTLARRFAPTKKRSGSRRPTRTGSSASVSRRRLCGDAAGAERAYRDGLRHNPRSLPLAYRLALILAAERRPVALFAWRRALAIEPRSAAAREGLRAWELSGRDPRGPEARP